jgi:hypothetical protein
MEVRAHPMLARLMGMGSAVEIGTATFGSPFL